jgi:FkbM family methyltransferase
MHFIDSQLSLHTTEDDIKYLLFDTDKIISEQIRSDGNWNVDALKILDRILKNSFYGKVIDIGAGIGSVSIPLCIYNDNKFDFICFEPVKFLYYQLCSNVLLNKIKVIDAHRKIVSNENDRRAFKTFDIEKSTNHGSFSFIEKYNEFRNIEMNGEEMFDIVSIDSYNITDVKLMKISVSGMETSVIDGAVNTIKSSNLPPIALQYWNIDWFFDERQKIIEKIGGLGYTFYHETSGYIFFFKNEREYLQCQRDTIVVEDFNQYKVVEERLDVEDVLKNQSQISMNILDLK